MATRADPSGTTPLARRMARDVSRRLSWLAGKVGELVGVDDVFDLKDSLYRGGTTTNAYKKAWRFHTDTQKVKAFREWVDAQADAGVLSLDAKGYVEDAYKKGAVRAYVDSRPKGASKVPGFAEGSKKEFLEGSFNQPEVLSKVQLLATRSLEELKGVTDEAARRMTRILTQGLIKGENPKKLARQMSDEIKGLSKKRALVIARTEVVHAHAEGQLDAFHRMGVEGVGVMAEWSTAGDLRVCEECRPLEAMVLKVADARGLIPRHPNCRCAWIPADQVEQSTRLRAGAARKLKKSFVKAGQARSAWAGKNLIRKLARKAKRKGRAK